MVIFTYKFGIAPQSKFAISDIIPISLSLILAV